MFSISPNCRRKFFRPPPTPKNPRRFIPLPTAVLKSSGLVVVTPEYNGGMPGVLKYFIDMLKFPESFEKRPVCFVGVSAGIWGALRPIEQLQQIFGYRNAYIYPERVFLPQINNLLDDGGRLTDPELLGRLKAQAEGFVDFVERLQKIEFAQHPLNRITMEHGCRAYFLPLRHRMGRGSG